MGLTDIFGSSGPDWKCNNCGKVHSSNPEQCKKCGHKVLQQTR